LKAFLKRKNKHALIRKFNPTSNKKNYHHPTFVQYKEISINLFSLYNMKKKNKGKEKNCKRKRT
jgi:zona occludens toxin (predicted ATPase)